eukprot:gnl/MRDRNA2_/MRDRNA2_28494_c0_seq2.p1 gnl/MRDRNA2_/MRDRNA2_28494_c0~~gnl/MRDRNA2_/MRDRNA2_28494_c0_seq2.p1  ORF type:complete len:224 (+),score=29.86 gnl/MRDRNA2_/MRDRNA2_28494_c0_seq2:40-711(+)
MMRKLLQMMQSVLMVILLAPVAQSSASDLDSIDIAGMRHFLDQTVEGLVTILADKFIGRVLKVHSAYLDNTTLGQYDSDYTDYQRDPFAPIPATSHAVSKRTGFGELSQSGLQQLSNELRQTNDIMFQNLNQALEQGEKLGKLTSKAKTLSRGAVAFKSEQANRLRRDKLHRQHGRLKLVATSVTLVTIIFWLAFFPKTIPSILSLLVFLGFAVCFVFKRFFR